MIIKDKKINYNGEREDIPMMTLMNNEPPVSRVANATPSIITTNTNNSNNNNNNPDTISDALIIDTHVPRLNKLNQYINNKGDTIKKEHYKDLNKFLGQDSPIVYSNMNSQAEINSLNIEVETPSSSNDMSFNTIHDVMDPLIVSHSGDSYYSKKPPANLTHRRKMMKSSSNSYLLKSDSNDEVSEEQINLISNK